MVCCRMRLRIIMVPPETSTRARVISATTRLLSMMWRPPVEPRLESCKAGERLPRVSSQAGTTPNTMPAKSERPKAKPKAVRSTRASLKISISGGAMRLSKGTVQ